MADNFSPLGITMGVVSKGLHDRDARIAQLEAEVKLLREAAEQALTVLLHVTLGLERANAIQSLRAALNKDQG